MRRADLDLRALDLLPGAAARRQLEVPASTLELGGERYRLEPPAPSVRLDVSRGLTGLHLRLRARAELVGPCWRCLGEARAPIEIDATELSAEGRDPDAPFDDDLDSAYVDGHRLDLAGWLRDAVVDALPATVLCREDCPGLCPSCGAEWALGDCGCSVEAIDPRWSGLQEVAERLRREGGG